ncbi:MAG: glycosyltransferase family 4 protein [Synechococcaceae cyanobacterium]|nr:glycosyltransferase family 4 protein [Synechococcaceae cyanobacterium]
MTAPHVAYISADPGVPVFGNKGCSIHVRAMLAAFLRRGYRVSLLSARPGGDIPPALQQVALIPLPGLEPQESPEFEASVLAAGAAIEAALAALPPLDLLYERHSLWSFSGMEFGRSRGIRTCLEVNAPLVYEQQTYRQLLHPGLAQQTTRRAYRAADSIVAVSSGVKAAVEADLPHPHVHCVPNGVDLDRFAPPPPLQEPPGSRPFTIGFCGTLRPWHGVEDLLVAFASHHRRSPQSHLLIIGDGPQRAALEARAEALDLGEAVRFVGAVSHDHMPASLARLDVAVAPYQPMEKMYFSPLKIFESMAMGLCTVAADLGDIPRIIDDGRSGLLYAPGNCEQLAELFDRLSADRPLVQALGSQARRQALEQFSWDRVLDTTLRASHGPIA